MLIQTQDRWEAAYVLLNQILKDKRFYCNVCGTHYDKDRSIPCCDTPQIGNHFKFLARVIKQNKEKQLSNPSAYGESKEGFLRSCIAMPPVLWEDWNKAFENVYHEKLIRDSADLHGLMKKFPYLRTCDRV